MMSSDLLQIKKLLRSILISSQIVLDVSQLNEDFKELEGIDIPYQEMGFETLLDFLYSITDVLLVDGDSMYSKVNHVHSEKSAHVKEMVMKQRPSTKFGRFSSKKIRNERCERLSRDNMEQIESSDVGKREYLDNYNNTTNSNFTFEDNTQLENNFEGNIEKLFIAERDPYESLSEDENEHPELDMTQSSSIVIKNFNFIDDDLLEMSTNSDKYDHEDKNLLYCNPAKDNFNFEINPLRPLGNNIEHEAEMNIGKNDRNEQKKARTSRRNPRRIPKVNLTTNSIRNSSLELNENVSIKNSQGHSKPPIRNTRKKRNVLRIKDINKEQKVFRHISMKGEAERLIQEQNNDPRILNYDPNFDLFPFESNENETQAFIETDELQNDLKNTNFVQNTKVGIEENIDSNNETSKVIQNEQNSRKLKKQFSQWNTLEENKGEYFEKILMQNEIEETPKSPDIKNPGNQQNKNSSIRRSSKAIKETNLVDNISGEVKKKKNEIQDYSEENTTYAQIEEYHITENVEELKDSQSEEYRNHQIVHNNDLELEFSSQQKIGNVKKNSPFGRLQEFPPYLENGNLKIPEVDVNTPDVLIENQQNKIRKSIGQPQQNRKREIINNKRNNSQIVNISTSQKTSTNKQNHSQSFNPDTSSDSKKFQRMNRRKKEEENGSEISTFVRCSQLKTKNHTLGKNQNEQKSSQNAKYYLNESKCDNKSNSRSFNKERQNKQNSSISNVKHINVCEKQEEKIRKTMSINQEGPNIWEISCGEQKKGKKQLVASKLEENVLKRVIPHGSDLRKNFENEEIIAHDSKIIGRILRRIETRMSRQCRHISDSKKDNHKLGELGELNSNSSLRSNVKKQIDTRILKEKQNLPDFYFEQNNEQDNVDDSKINGRVSRRVYIS